MSKKMEIAEIVWRLVGPIVPTGQHGIDMNRMDSLEDLTDLVDALVNKIYVVSLHHDAQEDSVRRLGTRAKQFLESLLDYDNLREERDTAWQELREIREAINANPEESTADEVRALVPRLWPECSGDPGSCPENEGRGCCMPNSEAKANAGGND